MLLSGACYILSLLFGTSCEFLLLSDLHTLVDDTLYNIYTSVDLFCENGFHRTISDVRSDEKSILSKAYQW